MEGLSGHHLEGVPLAIELAAAYVQVLSPAQIRTRLTQRFNFLVNRNSNAPERHASLRATLDWSFRLLQPQLQRYFARLGTLCDGWTIEAAQSICTDLPDTVPPPPKAVSLTDLRKKRTDLPATPLSILTPSYLCSSDAMQPLIDLRERSLIRVQEHNKEMRYFMLETVREYALEQLSEEDHDTTHMRHARFFLQLVEEAEANLAGPDAVLWLNKLQIENANIQAALRFLLPDTRPANPLPKTENGKGYEGLRLASAMGAFWFVRGYLKEGLTWLNKVLQMYSEAPPLLRSKALRQLANIAYQNGDLDLAHSTYNELLTVAQSMGDNVQLAAALSGLAIIVRLRGDLDTALSLREQSLELFRAEGYVRGIALATGGLGIIAKQRRDYHTARQYFEEVLTLYREQNDPHNIALALNNLADCLLAMDLLPEAYACLFECLPIVHALNNKNGVILGLLNLVSLARKQNQFDEAAKLLGSVENQILSYPGSSTNAHNEEIIAEKKLIIDVLGESEFLRAWQQGLYISFEQAITYRFIQG